MPLTWDVSKVKDAERVTSMTVDGEERWHPVTETLVFMSLFIGMPTITEGNAAEFYTRTRMYETVFGPSLIKDGEFAMLTWEHVQSHIGLRTNATPKTRAKFNGELTGYLRRKAENTLREARETAAKAAQVDAQPSD